MNSITWRGVSSTTIDGLLISELPPISKPTMRIKETVIDGRDGSVVEDLGYSSYNKSVLIGLHGEYDIDKVIKYFTGEGDLVFSNEPDKVYKARIASSIDFQRLVRYRTASVTFLVQPYKYKKDEAMKETEVVTTSGTSIVVNPKADEKLASFRIYGKSTQNGTPTPDAPIDIVSIGSDGSVAVLVADGADEDSQSIEIITPMGLHGFIVSKDGNYTDAEGKQWLCDVVDLARGVLIKRTNTLILVGDTSENITRHSANTHGIANFFINIGSHPSKLYAYAKSNRLSLQTTAIADTTDEGFLMSGNNGIYFRVASSKASNVDEFKSMLRQWESEGKPLQVCYALETPLEESLTEEQIAIFKAMNLNEPSTTITNDENAYMSVGYFKPFEVFNEGLESSKPLMVLKGSGTVEISVNDVGIFTYTFPEGENEVYIDSEKEDAYLGSALKNRNMNGEFPILLPKTNKIEWSGDVESIEILPRSRWL